MTQKAVKITGKWSKDTGLAVNRGDLFSRNKIPNGFRDPKIFGKEIIKKKSVHRFVNKFGGQMSKNLAMQIRLQNRMHLAKCLKILYSFRALENT